MAGGTDGDVGLAAAQLQRVRTHRAAQGGEPVGFGDAVFALELGAEGR